MGIGPIGDCMQSILVPQFAAELVFPTAVTMNDDIAIYASADKERADIASALQIYSGES